MDTFKHKKNRETGREGGDRLLERKGMKGILFNIQKFSIHDGPGIRTVLFFKGCPLTCRWCCNPESQRKEIELALDGEKCVRCGECIAGCPGDALHLGDDGMAYDPGRCHHCGVCVSRCLNGAISFFGREYGLEEVMEEIRKDKPFYDKSGGGVTFSGGEVFLQADFARELSLRLSAESIKVALETSLAVPTDRVEKLIDHVETWLVDFKHYDREQFLRGTGGDLSLLHHNLKILQDHEKEIILRIPLIPGYNDSPGDALRFAKALAAMGIDGVELLPFHQLGEKKYELLGRNYPLKGISRLKGEDLTGFARILEEHRVQVNNHLPSRWFGAAPP